MPGRAAIYARYSTDLQSDRSIEDQAALCHALATREGLSVTRSYADRARTSSSLLNRDGLQDLMADARAGLFDVLIVESFDRLSRDQGDLAALNKRLRFQGIEIVTVNDGRANTVSIGLHGLMGEMWMEGHKAKVRRGMAGVIRDGRHAGGRAYGYAPVAGQPGELQIVADEAAVIRRIFTTFADGTPARAIAADLNRDAVTPPRGRAWNASTIIGNAARACGILRNDIYRGQLVWNRVRMVRDPETGLRVSRPNPAADWQWTAAEPLRIVPDDLWERAQAQIAHRCAGEARGRALARPRRPLSGLLRCGYCGGGLSISHQRGDRVFARCSRAHESGTCTARAPLRLDLIEGAVFARLADELRDPVYLRAWLAEYHAERQRLAQSSRRDRAQLERTAARARTAATRARQLYIQGLMDGPEAEAEIRRLQTEAATAEADLARADSTTAPLTLHPAALALYAATLDSLAPSLATAEADNAPAVQSLRQLITEVRVTVEADALDIEVSGRLSELLGDHRAKAGGTVVAGVRLAPLPTIALLQLRVTR